MLNKPIFNKHRAQRLYYIVLLIIGMAMAAGLILYALKQNINLFFTPSQALLAHLPQGHTFRLGGQVKPGSLIREKNNLTVHFILTDRQQDIRITYSGILPDLFREGSGAIVQGHWDATQVFVATDILAKHDEKYMPRGMMVSKNMRG